MANTLTQDFNRLDQMLEDLAGEEFDEDYGIDNNIDADFNQLLDHDDFATIDSVH